MTSSDTLRSSDASVVADVAEATNFLKQFFQGTAKQRARRVVKAPLGAVQTAALHHPDPWVRRDCLFFLDHYANDQSMALFARALGDPVEFVRNMALHGLSCQACKSEVLCTADVAAGLVEVLEHDPSHELRTKAIQLLFQLSDGRPGPGRRSRRRRSTTRTRSCGRPHAAHWRDASSLPGSGTNGGSAATAEGQPRCRPAVRRWAPQRADAPRERALPLPHCSANLT